ncbi:uncharacterized protein LOC144909368 [Branchiostoma floridae x Branchiostoma belcheri]
MISTAQMTSSVSTSYQTSSVVSTQSVSGSASTVTGLALCDHTFDIICAKISTDWRAVCIALGCGSDMITKVVSECGSDDHLCCGTMLKLWRDTWHVDYSDKVDHLCTALRTAATQTAPPLYPAYLWYTDCAGIVYDKHRTECSVVLCDSQIDIYSKKLSDDWKAFCTALGCDYDFITKIEQDCGHDNYLCISTALKHWRDTVDAPTWRRSTSSAMLATPVATTISQWTAEITSVMRSMLLLRQQLASSALAGLLLYPHSLSLSPDRQQQA